MDGRKEDYPDNSEQEAKGQVKKWKEERKEKNGRCLRRQWHNNPRWLRRQRHNNCLPLKLRPPPGNSINLLSID
jgi:hypothetical protein